MTISNYFTILLPMLFSIIFPLELLLMWKKKTKAKIWCFLTGSIVFAVFALGLEQIAHLIFLNPTTKIGQVVLSSSVLYTLYGSFATGIFEETGRLFGFKVMLRKHKENECAVAYGIGHGGIEAIIVLGLTYFVYFIGMLGLYPDKTVGMQLANIASTIPFGMALVAILERLSAIVTHIGLSLIMFVASNKKGKLWLFPVAIVLHAFVDVFACLYKVGVITSVAVLEGIVLVLGLLVFFLGIKIMTPYLKVSKELPTIE